MPKTNKKKRSDLDFIMDWEGGDEEMSVTELAEGFCQLANGGTLNGLQGMYGRTFNGLKESGIVKSEKGLWKPDPKRIEELEAQ